MWLKNANAGNDCAGPDTGTETWATALASAAACNAGAGYAGHTDWRLPNVREQHSLINYGSSPALPSGHPFTGVLLNYYWASTTAAVERRHREPRQQDGHLPGVAGAWRTMMLGRKEVSQ